MSDDKGNDAVRDSDHAGQAVGQGITRFPVVRSFLAALLTAGITLPSAIGLDLVDSQSGPALFFIVLGFGVIAGLFQERMAKYW